MSKFVIHKKGFYYTDEAFMPLEDSKGSIAGIFDDIEAAKKEKESLDISSMQRLAGMLVTDFIFEHPNRDEIIQNLEEYYKSEFNLEIENEDCIEFPKEISAEQAESLLKIMDITFHDIVEYSNEEDFNEDNYMFNEEDEIMEF